MGFVPILRGILGVSALLGGVSCAPIPYADSSPLGEYLYKGGIDQLQLSDTSFQIIIEGNGYTSPARVQDFMMLRASEIALTNGYRYFRVAETANIGRTGFSADAGGPATPYSASTTFRPGVAAIINLDKSAGLDALTINRQLAPKYGVAPTAIRGVAP